MHVDTCTFRRVNNPLTWRERLSLWQEETRYLPDIRFGFISIMLHHLGGHIVSGRKEREKETNFSLLFEEDTYGVPVKVVATSIVPTRIRLIPKSPILTWFDLRKIFLAFRSRWRIRDLCMYWTASRIWINHSTTWLSSKRRSCFFNSFNRWSRSPPSQYSVMMHRQSFSRKLS